MTDGFMGPPWQLDWTEGARTYRDSLPLEIREQVHDVAITLVTAKNPLQPEDCSMSPPGLPVPKARTSSTLTAAGDGSGTRSLPA